MDSTQAEAIPRCARCSTPLRKTAYEVRKPSGGRVLRCLRCSLLYAPMLRRSAVVALIVGTILTAINQGNIILAGDFPASLYWKVPLTYCVPFCVATTGALLNARFYFRAEREGEYTDVSREAAGPHV